MPNQHTPSLLEPESRGGENAGRGFDFQDHFLVSQLPCWLEQEGFICLLREAIGDIEVRMFTPGYDESIEIIEVKNYRLTPAVFWAEVDRFYSIDRGSPDTFRWFRLVAPDVSSEIAPLMNGLRRLQSPYGFYPENSGVIQNSLDSFTQLVTAASKPSEYADFLFSRVLIDIGHGTGQEHGEALFRQNLGECLPEYQHLPYHVVSSLYTALLRLVSPRNTPVTRKEMEQVIRASIPADQLRPFSPIRLHTAYQSNETKGKALVLDWSEFFGGSTRTYPDVEKWNAEVVGQLNDIKEFILNHRNTRHVYVTGSRRLSAAIALGTVFSATGGFVVTFEHRDGMLWNTNDHARSDDTISLDIKPPQGQGEGLIVCIGIPNDIRQSVENYAKKGGISRFPVLSVTSPRPIENARQANSIVAQLKSVILQSLSHTQSTQIHLFCAVPSFLALLLGHRLNATASVQCYEFVSQDMYVPTCVLAP